MKTIRHTATLFYYDGPQVFEACDPIGGHYLALAVDAPEVGDRYLVVGVPPERLRQFRAGIRDLREILAEAGQEDWYLAIATDGLDRPLRIERQSTPIVESGFLPDEGFVLHDRPAEESILEEARKRQNLVLEVAIEPPEAAGEHRIRVNTLAGLLLHVQTLVKHAHRAAWKALSPKSRGAIDLTNASLMDVVIPASPGSFRFVMEAVQAPDMFGHSELTRALERIDMLFEGAATPQDALTTLKEQRGHLAGAYLKFLRFLMVHKTGVRYSWAEPIFTKSNSHAVSEAEVGPLVDVLSSVTNLGRESITLIGKFQKFNRGTGTWGLLTEEGTSSGQVREGGPSLDGLQVGGHYRFFCEEEIEEIEGTGHERRKLYLNEYAPV